MTQTANVHDEVSKTVVELGRTPDINGTCIGVTAAHEVNTLLGEVELQDGLLVAGFLEGAVQRVEKITVGDLLGTGSEMTPKNSVDQLRGGCFVQSIVFHGTNDMRVFQQEIFGPVVTVVSFIDYLMGTSARSRAGSSV